MSINIKSEEVIIEEVDLFGNFNRVKSEEGPELTGGGGSMEAEKRIRREIANSNERRRMQSINAGFQSLRTLLPHHEGEKLSKAAILQQTAEYIYSLEQEKTRLLSQNSQLKRLVNQHEGNEIPTKKRKHENTTSSTPSSMTTISTTVISESSDEGIDTMSPEPIGVSVVQQTNTNIELLEVRAQLERERRMRLLLEDQLRTLESQVVYSSQVYQTNGDDAVLVSLPEDMQVVSMESVPPVAQTQTVESSPQIMSRSPSPQLQQRLPSALEAAIKAEPKVEVERLPSPTPSCPEEITSSSQTHLYVHANTSRQNLETIVEAIRHLEGEIFDDTKQRSTTVVSTVRATPTAPVVATQEVPLALTTKPKEITQRLLNPYLQFHPTVQQQQQTRPGVIVVKSHS